MATDTSRHPLRPDRPVTVGSYLLVLAVVGVLFAATFSAYVTAETAYRVDIESTGYSLDDGGDALTVTLRFSNPASHALEVISSPFTATLNVYAQGERYSEVGETQIDGATVPAGGSATVTTTFDVADDHRDDVAAAIERDALVMRGEFGVRIVEQKLTISAGDTEVNPDG